LAFLGAFSLATTLEVPADLARLDEASPCSDSHTRQLAALEQPSHGHRRDVELIRHLCDREQALKRSRTWSVLLCAHALYGTVPLNRCTIRLEERQVAQKKKAPLVVVESVLDTLKGRQFATVWRPYVGSHEIRVFYRAIIVREGEPIVVLTIDAIRTDQPPQCVGVEIRPAEGSDEIQGSIRLPMDKLLREAIIAGRRRVGEQGATSDSVRDALLDEPTRRAKRRTVTDELLEEVATTYRRALEEKERDPVNWVAKEVHTSRSNAGKLVARARKRGLLAPTEPRRAKA
jgi:hypothetical protein